MSAAVPLLPKSFPDQATAQRRTSETVNNILTFQNDDSRIQTPAEILAGVTPVNYAYAPGRVDRYQTNTSPGATNMYAGFQAAINQCRKGGADVTWGDTGIYLIGDGTNATSNALDCTFAGSGSQYGLTFRQVGTPAFNFPPSTRGGIVVNHSAYTVFDLTGCEAFTFYDLTLVTNNGGVFPKSCFLTARNSVGESNLPRFYNTKVAGWFTDAVLYNYSSEDGVYVGNFWENANTASACVVYLTGSNILAYTSAYTTIYSGSISCTDHEFLGGQYDNIGGNASSDIFRLDNCTGLKVWGAWFNNSSPSAGGRAYIYVNMTNAAASRIHLRDIVGEDTAHYSSYGILFGSEASGTASDWAIQDCYIPNATNPINAPSTCTLDKFNIANLVQQAGHSLSAAGTVQFSTLNCGSTLGLTIGTDKQNNITADFSNVTITTRQNSLWNDVGSAGQYSFTPNTSGITFSGGTPAATGTVSYEGRYVTVQITLSGQTTLSATAGQQITGLPLTPTAITADVSLWNLTNDAAVGGGIGEVTGTGITLPAFSIGSNQLLITARYKA